MQQAAKKLLEAAMDLEPEQRAELAATLVASIDDHFEDDRDLAALVEQRCRDIDEGKDVLVDWDTARDEILADLRANR